MRSYEGTSLAFTNIVILSSRRLNAHLSSIVSSKPFQMPVEVASRTTASSGSRLSSFGFSGTIAHGAFEARKTIVSVSNDSKSLYRNRRSITPSDTTRLGWLLEAPSPQQSRLDEAVVFSGALSPLAEALFSHHVVGGAIILPGVGYVEMAFAASSLRALTAVAFLRPCVLSGPGRGKKSVLRCAQRGAALEIASKRTFNESTGDPFAVNFMGTQETGHKVQFVERITTTNKGARSHFLKARTDHELRDEPSTLELRNSVSVQRPNALTQYEPVSRWTDEVAQTGDIRSLLPPQNQETTGTGIDGHSRSSRLSALETVVLQFLSTSQ
jgi:acyl transferase domain-containing protein